MNSTSGSCKCGGVKMSNGNITISGNITVDGNGWFCNNCKSYMVYVTKQKNDDIEIRSLFKYSEC